MPSLPSHACVAEASHPDYNAGMALMNLDAGEHDDEPPELWRLFDVLSIACGGHAGDEQTMATTIQQALRHKLAIGAHPGYADRENFGRIELNLSPEAIADSIHEQLRALAEIADRHGVRLAHVKPHGALYNQAVHNRQLAQAIATGVARLRRDVVLVGLAGSPMLDVFRQAGFPVAAEAFADRRYEPDGTLRSRKHPDALIHDPAEAAQQALSIVQGKVVAWDGSEVPMHADTLCIHSDTPGSPQIAAQVAKTLREAGVNVRAFE